MSYGETQVNREEIWRAPRAQNGQKYFPLHLRLWHSKCGRSLFQKISIKGLSTLDTPKHFIITKIFGQVSPPLKEHFSSFQCMCVCVLYCSEGWQVKCVIFSSGARLKYGSGPDITTQAHPMAWVWGQHFFSPSNGKLGKYFKLPCYENAVWTYLYADHKGV